MYLNLKKRLSIQFEIINFFEKIHCFFSFFKNFVLYLHRNAIFYLLTYIKPSLKKFGLINNLIVIKERKKYNMSQHKLDKIDLKILKILQSNSKITNLELSKTIGLSPAPTLERVKKLESSEIVDSYHAVVKPEAIGLSVKTFVLVSLAWQKENALNNFLSKVKEIEEITECYIITGEADFLMKLVCKDIPTYEQLLFKTLSQIEEIERLKTLMTLSTVKDSKVLPFKYE